MPHMLGLRLVGHRRRHADGSDGCGRWHAHTTLPGMRRECVSPNPSGRRDTAATRLASARRASRLVDQSARSDAALVANMPNSVSACLVVINISAEGS